MKSENEELRTRVSELEDEVRLLESRLKQAVQDQPRAEPAQPAGTPFLMWAFWLLLIAALGASLYKILSGAGGKPIVVETPPSIEEPAPRPRAPEKLIKIQPKQPTKKPDEPVRFPGFPDTETPVPPKSGE
ncbi:hypothetical protein ACFL2T_07935 [Elusimicrobiota bacterium]